MRLWSLTPTRPCLLLLLLQALRLVAEEAGGHPTTTPLVEQVRTAE